MKNIKFFTSEYNLYFKDVANSKFVSFVNYFLRLHHELRSVNPHAYKWLPPEILVIGQEPGEGMTPEYINDIINDLEKESVDIIGISVYTWNTSIFKILCKEIKKRLPNIIIIGGGPELNAHTDTEFFKKNPWYDYVIYGDGEKAFTVLLDYISGSPTNLINVVSSDGTVYPHEVFNDKDLLRQSPYLTYATEIKEYIRNYRIKYAQKFNNRQQAIIVAWETTKGCPYTCSFCDWSSGLHNKVRFWGKKSDVTSEVPTRPTYQLELDLFTEIRAHSIMWTNPNAGLGPQDEELVDYWCESKKKNPNTPFSFVMQLSKVKKDVAHRLLKKMLSAGVERALKFDLQDLDPTVLDNIDRPEIPWHEHKEMIRSVIHEFPDSFSNYRAKLNFIWGLPGQTLKHFDYNLTEGIELGFRVNYFYFELLPNSPANKPEYIKKYNLNIEKIYVNHIEIPNYITEVTDDLINNYCVEANLVTASYSMSRKEWFTGIVKYYIYNYYFNTLMNMDIRPLLDNAELYDDIIDDMYEYFCQTKIISIHAVHIMNSGLYKNFKNRIDNVIRHIYNIETLTSTDLPLLLQRRKFNKHNNLSISK